MWYFFEYLVVVVAVTIIVTQIIIPTLMGTRMFPMFRRRKLVSRVEEARELLVQMQLEEEARELERKAYYEPEVSDSADGKESPK